MPSSAVSENSYTVLTCNNNKNKKTKNKNLYHSPFQGGDTSESDLLWADGDDGTSFVHPSGELYLQPLAGICLEPLILSLASSSSIW